MTNDESNNEVDSVIVNVEKSIYREKPGNKPEIPKGIPKEKTES